MSSFKNTTIASSMVSPNVSFKSTLMRGTNDPPKVDLAKCHNIVESRKQNNEMNVDDTNNDDDESEFNQPLYYENYLSLTESLESETYEDDDPWPLISSTNSSTLYEDVSKKKNFHNYAQSASSYVSPFSNYRRSNNQSAYGPINERNERNSGFDRTNSNVTSNNGSNNGSNIICSNCRKMGHFQRNCKKPIQSYGIIAIQFGVVPRYLMIRRRNSIGYETFLRGRYDNELQMHLLIDRMTSKEKEMILNTDFDTLWDDLCVIRESKFYKYGKPKAKAKFDEQDIQTLFKDTSSIWDQPSWGFPKGRRFNQKESDIQCATREFIEETNMDRDNFRIVFTKPFSETYTGTNDIRYKHTYYIAMVSKSCPLPTIDPTNIYQQAEIGDIGWFTLDEAVAMIKPYNEEKKQVLREVHEYISEFIFDTKPESQPIDVSHTTTTTTTTTTTEDEMIKVYPVKLEKSKDDDIICTVSQTCQETTTK